MQRDCRAQKKTKEDKEGKLWEMLPQMWSSGPFEETMLGKFGEKDEKRKLCQNRKSLNIQQDEEGDEEQHLNDESILAALGINEIGLGFPGEAPY